MSRTQKAIVWTLIICFVIAGTFFVARNTDSPRESNYPILTQEESVVPEPQSSGQPSWTVTPPTGYTAGQGIMLESQIRPLVERTFPSAKQSGQIFLQSQYTEVDPVAMNQFVEERIPTYTTEITAKRSCDAAERFLADARAKFGPNIPLGIATMNDRRATFLVFVAREAPGSSVLQLFRIAPLSGAGMDITNVQSQMQKVAIN